MHECFQTRAFEIVMYIFPLVGSEVKLVALGDEVAGTANLILYVHVYLS